jgi:hypothetical protein
MRGVPRRLLGVSYLIPWVALFIRSMVGQKEKGSSDANDVSEI